MNTILKYPGSKWSLTNWIISNFPSGYEKMTYLEPFFGSGAIFFNKNRSMIETINDIDGRIVNLFKVIREKPDELSRLIQLTPWSRDEYKLSYEPSEIPIEDARRLLVRCWQAIGTKLSDKSGWSNNIKPVDSGISRWSRLDETIFMSASRMRNENQKIVQIENMPAIKLIERYNRKETFIYCDPPYVMSTRSGRIYAHEMKDQDHVDLLNILKKHNGPVMISGYQSDLYDELLKGWRKDFEESQTAMGGKAIEVIWMNYEPAIKQITFNL